MVKTYTDNGVYGWNDAVEDGAEEKDDGDDVNAEGRDDAEDDGKA